MSNTDDYGPDPDILPDELISKHLDAGPARTAVGTPNPDELDADEFEDSEDDNPYGGPDEDDPENEDDEGEGEPDDELDDDGDEEGGEGDSENEPDALLDTASKEDIERIKADPALSKLHRSMQKHFTQKTQAAAERERRAVAREEAVNRLESTLSDPQGMADYLRFQLESRPDVVGAAFEAVAVGENGLAFLTEVGLAHPEMLESAYDRVQELLSDESEKSRHIRERDVRMREQRLEQRDQQARRSTFDAEFSGLTKAAEKEALRLGLQKDELPEVAAKLRDAVRPRVGKDGRIDLRPDDAKKIAREVKASLELLEAKVQRRLERRSATTSQERTKQKAASASRNGRRVAPGPVGRGRPTANTPFKAPPNTDPLDAFIAHRLEG